MERHEIEAEIKKMLAKLNAVFLLAGIDVKSFHQLPNGYCGDQCCPHRPWGLAETKYGLIKIGWRKRVISIEWPKEVDVHGKNVKSNEEAWITDWENGVHAYSWGKAVDYLEKFVELANQAAWKREADARLTTDELEEYERLMDAHKTNPGPFPSRLQSLYDKRVGKQN